MTERPVVKVHTIEQWESLDQPTKTLILQNIRLKSRLEDFLKKKFVLPPIAAHYEAACRDCAGTGKVTIRARLPGLHPSQLYHRCMLKIFNQMLGKEEKRIFNFRLQLIFEVGKYVHLMFQNYGLSGAWGKHYKPEAEVSELLQPLAHELLLEGSADADNILVIDDIPDAPIFEVGIIHEYKTINSNGFGSLTTPKPEHKQQAIVYSAALNRPVTVYLYMNKDTQDLKDMPIAFDQPLWSIVKDKAVKLNSYYDSGVEPPGFVSYDCKECGFAYSCEAYHSQGVKHA